MTGLLVFLGLLGTFWGLIETVGSVGKVIEGLEGRRRSGALFDTLKDGLAAPLGGMGISFSSSLFGLAGSLILGFLDLQSSQAQNRFYTDLEDWLASTVREYGDGGSGIGGELQHAMERMRTAAEESGGSRSTTAAMANLAEAIQGLVAHGAHRAADDPRMGRRPGRAEPRDQEAAGADRQTAREELKAMFMSRTRRARQ